MMNKASQVRNSGRQVTVGVALTLGILVAAVSIPGCQPSASIVNFPDPRLEVAIREAISKETGDIYDIDLVGLTVLELDNFRFENVDILEEASYSGCFTLQDWRDSLIVDVYIILEGIQYCVDLTELYLVNIWSNDYIPGDFIDLSPLSGLINLTKLGLEASQIVDLSPLSGLINLTELNLGSNQIIDLSPLSGLINLTELNLGSNQIIDLSPLSGLINLTELNLESNQIVDLSLLSGLINLTELNMGSNQIIDIHPLSGLTSLAWLSLQQNKIVDIGPLSGLINLTHLHLSNVHNVAILNDDSGGWFTIQSFRIEYPQGNKIVDISPLSGLTNLTELDLERNKIVDIQALVDNAGLGERDYVDIYSNNLDLTPGSPAMLNIEALQDRGAEVNFEQPDWH